MASSSLIVRALCPYEWPAATIQMIPVARQTILLILDVVFIGYC